MPQILRNTLLSARDFAATAGPFALLALVLLTGAYLLLKPNPPRHVVLATGPEGSDFAEFGKRYAEELKRRGIEVKLVASPGSSANLRMLRGVPASNGAADSAVPAAGATNGATPPAVTNALPKSEMPVVDFAFVQGGSSEALRAIDEDMRGVPLVALGSLFYEPVWIFYREDSAKRLNKSTTITELAQLKGWRVNVGGRGGGTSGIMSKLLTANGIERDSLKRSRLDQTPAVMAFLAAEQDAVVFASAPESPMVRMLLMTPGVKLFEFPQAEAYSRQLAFLTPVVLPRGVVDIARNMPPRDVPLVALTTSLIAREGTHPALLQLFVQAAHKIHGGNGWFSRAGQFPSAQSADLPLAKEAERYYRSGPPLLQRYLPFWLANLIDRMWVALISIIAILIPLTRVLPPLYQFRIRSRIFRWYRGLREIEEALNKQSAPPTQLLERLDRIDAHLEQVSVPLSYADQLYDLKSHVQMVRERLKQAK